MRRAPRGVHIGRVKDDTIYRRVLVRKFPAINPSLEIGREQLVTPCRHVPPENAPAEGDIGNHASRRNVKIQNVRKHIIIPAEVGAEDQLISGLAVADTAAFRRRRHETQLFRICHGNRVRGERLFTPTLADCELGG